VPLAVTHAKVAREFLPLLLDNWKVSSAAERSPSLCSPIPASTAHPLACACVVISQVWPLVTLVNFVFVPPKLQVLFGNVISIFCMHSKAQRSLRGLKDNLQQLTCHCNLGYAVLLLQGLLMSLPSRAKQHHSINRTLSQPALRRRRLLTCDPRRSAFRSNSQTVQVACRVSRSRKPASTHSVRN
jgi:hypothetical protein